MVDDAFYQSDLLLANISTVHAIIAILAIACVVVLIGLPFFLHVRIDGIMRCPGLALVSIYLFSSYTIYPRKSPCRPG